MKYMRMVIITNIAFILAFLTVYMKGHDTGVTISLWIILNIINGIIIYNKKKGNW